MAPVISFRDFNADSSSIYYFDTCSLCLILLNTRQNNIADKQEVIRILTEIVSKQGFISTSELANDELHGVIRKQICDSFKQCSNEKRDDVLLRLPYLHAQIEGKLNEAINDFINLPGYIQSYNNNESLRINSQSVTVQTGLESNDAKHLVIAKSMQADVFVTVDSDFSKVNDPDLKILLPDRFITPNTAAININIPTIELPS